jgi:hypothetical protein
MNNVFISSETVANARNALPPAHLSSNDVIEIQVIAQDGKPAMIEFERIRSRAGDGKTVWSWEAMTCWQA